MNEYMYVFVYIPVALQPSAGLSLLILWCLYHTQRRTTVGGTPLGVCSAYRKEFYIIIHNIHKWQTALTPAEFEHAISQQANVRIRTP